MNTSQLLRTLQQALKPEFLAEVRNGLLLVYDEIKQVTHLGWIKEVTVDGNVMTAVLGLSVKQKHGESDWERLESFTHETSDISSFTALPHVGGFHCTDTRMSQATFKIYPAKSIPPDYARGYEQLIEYGNMLR